VSKDPDSEYRTYFTGLDGGGVIMAAAAGGSRLARSQSTTTTELSLGKTLRKVIRSGSKISGRSPISRRKVGSWAVILPNPVTPPPLKGTIKWISTSVDMLRIEIRKIKPRGWFLTSLIAPMT
jgi:hypothetical protein